jgi:hypothetical protein
VSSGGQKSLSLDTELAGWNGSRAQQRLFWERITCNRIAPAPKSRLKAGHDLSNTGRRADPWMTNVDHSPHEQPMPALAGTDVCEKSTPS